MSTGAAPVDVARQLRALEASLIERYRAIAEGPMADVPICNPRLGVAALGFRVVGEEAVGAVITPWFLNIVATRFSHEAAAIAPAELGATRTLALPAGVLSLIVGELDGIGRCDAASLFSPMHEFADMPAALDAARAALDTLFAVPAPPAFDRRAFLRGRSKASEAEA
jgi:[NiFe] hydrogenase assembly HybE family chaperone